MIKCIKKNENLTFSIKYFILIPTLAVLLGSCSSIHSQSDSDSSITSVEIALKLTRPILERAFSEQAPVLPVSKSRFLIANHLPGKSSFRAAPPQKGSISYGADGGLQLAPGDYNIPVMTYCMHVGGASPSAHHYTLSALQGTRAEIIHDVNRRALPQFSPEDVQVLTWSLLAGLKFDDLTVESKRIINTIAPEAKNSLKESLLSQIENSWNKISDRSRGIIPTFDEATDDLFDQLGDVGQLLEETRDFRNTLREKGNDYSSLSGMIDTDGDFTPSHSETPWSKISEQVYARFVTEGEFQDPGLLQIRVLSAGEKRSPGSQSTKSEKISIDINSWIADPENPDIQPLTFALLVDAEGVLVIPEVAPVVAAAMLASVLSAEVIEWNSFFKLNLSLSDVGDARIRQLLKRGNITLREDFDELEKPAHDAGVIDKTTQKVKEDKDSETRQYEKSGGVEALEKDFDKFIGEAGKAQDGTDYKNLPDGKRVVKRIPKDGDDKKMNPTLEIQPNENIKPKNRLRIKVRYPK